MNHWLRILSIITVLIGIAPAPFLLYAQVEQQPISPALETKNGSDILLSNETPKSDQHCEALTQQGIEFYVRKIYTNALHTFEEAFTCFQAEGNQEGLGKTLNHLGGMYYTQGRYEQALEKFQAALAIRREVGDQEGEEITLKNIAIVHDNIGDGYLLQGNYSQALKQFQAALAIRRDRGDRKDLGRSYHNIGVIYYAQGRYAQALVQFDLALTIARDEGDRQGESITVSSVGLTYSDQGHYSKALAQFNLALTIARDEGDREGESIALNNIGRVYYAQGYFIQALEKFQASLTIDQAMGDRNSEGITLHNIGAVYLAQKRFTQALTQFNAALAIRREVGDWAGEGKTLSNIGEVYREQGRYEEALAYYEAALAILHEVGDQAVEGQTLNDIGNVFDSQGRHIEALVQYKAALAVFRVIGDRSHEGGTLHNIGRVYRVQKRYAEALTQFELALAIAREIGDRVGEGTTLHNIAVLYSDQNQIDQAIDYYTQGLNVLDAVRSVAGNDLARADFVESYMYAYNSVLALYSQHQNVEQAFWYSERGRARVLLDILATNQVALSDNKAATLFAMEQEAYAARQSAQDALAKAYAANPPAPTWESEAEATLQAAEANYELAAAAITTHSDQMASLIPGHQRVLQLADVQALLDTDTTLLSYWTLEDKTLAFVITAHNATIGELPGVTAQTVLSATQNLYQWRNLDNPYPAPLRQLYQSLIAPVADKLKTTHLAIIPHQSLHYVPFAALIDEASDKQYLGEQYTLSILPSANLLPYLQQNEKAAQANLNGQAIIIGDPASNESDLPRLHYAQAEANAVAAILHTHAFTHTAASEATLHTAAQGARVVHLAAHGGYNQANALYSAIYLAPSQPLTPTQPFTSTDLITTVDTTLDGRLETHEIFGLPLKGNDLVVLSACQTNIGDLSRGDEIVGLTRAFFFAGSPTVISSLWNVDDAATETLMVAFYRHWLQEGMSKAHALQAAQADVRNAGRESPFYWAGFVLNGDPGKGK